MMKTMTSAAVAMAASLAMGPAVVAGTQRTPPRVERVQWLADEVEDSAERMREGTRARGRLTFAELQALRRLDALVNAARIFHQDVERRPFAWRTAESLDDLLATHDRADRSLPVLRMSPDARREQRRLSELVARLDNSYATLARGSRQDHGGYRQDRGGEDDRIGRR